MRFRYFMTVYQWHFSQEGVAVQPTVSAYVPEPSEGGQVLSVVIDVPDNLFGPLVLTTAERVSDVPEASLSDAEALAAFEANRDSWKEGKP